jgi:hypothetical protein
VSAKLSATMVAALSLANDHGGILLRFRCGCWSWYGAPLDYYSIPIEYASARTIEALVARGRMKFIDWSVVWGHPTIAQVTNTDETLNRELNKEGAP